MTDTNGFFILRFVYLSPFSFMQNWNQYPSGPVRVCPSRTNCAFPAVKQLSTAEKRICIWPR